MSIYELKKFPLVFLMVFLFSLLISGCATKIQQEPSKFFKPKNVKAQNYTIGKALTANVGESMVKFQDFWEVISETSVASIDKPVRLTGGGATIDVVIEPGVKYKVIGYMKDEFQRYMLIRLSTGHLAMIKDDGSLHNHVASQINNNEIIQVVWDLSNSDSSARVTREIEKRIDVKNGYENFELLYTGVNANGLNLTYREFSPEGLARVAFFQNLSYPPNSKLITFKKYKIEVERANSRDVVFTILEDGM